MRQCRVLQARRAGSILTYVTREASAARREIGRETPPSVVFCEMSVVFFEFSGSCFKQFSVFNCYVELLGNLFLHHAFASGLHTFDQRASGEYSLDTFFQSGDGR